MGQPFSQLLMSLRPCFPPPHLHTLYLSLALNGVSYPIVYLGLGGFWERLIGLTKFTLKKVLGRAFTTLISLQTLIVEIEAILNGRPLTYVPTDASDPDPITPAHLLYGRKIVCVPYYVTPQYDMCDPDFGEAEVQSRAKKQAALLQHFWSRWKREYLTGLRDFHHVKSSNADTSNLVLWY